LGKYFIFIVFLLFFAIGFGKKPAKKSRTQHSKHLILPKAKRKARTGKVRPSVVRRAVVKKANPSTNVASKQAVWEPDAIWTIDGTIFDKELTPKNSEDKELKAGLTYLCKRMEAAQLLDSVTFMADDKLTLPLAAMKEGKRYVVYSPTKLNSPQLKKQLSGIVYQMTHHALNHTAKEDANEMMLEADSTFAYWQYTAKAMVSSRYRTFLIDSLPVIDSLDIPTKEERKNALALGKKAAEELKVPPKTAAFLKESREEAARLQKRKKGVFAILFLGLVILLGGVTYLFTRKI
ncbi:MAG: hypothetical protein ACKVTZ_21205, partial [Bacteroidia bacterium]